MVMVINTLGLTERVLDKYCSLYLFKKLRPKVWCAWHIPVDKLRLRSLQGADGNPLMIL